MLLNFNWKHNDLELRAIPEGLVRQNEDEENHTIELIKWNKDSHCFTLAYWVKEKEGYVLKSVGDRPFNYIDEDELPILWLGLIRAQNTLDKFYNLNR